MAIDCLCPNHKNMFECETQYYGPAHYPVPAIPVKVGFHQAHHTQLFPCAYWYVSTMSLMWTFFDKIGMVEQRWK